MKRRKFRFHLIGTYHLPQSKKYLPCAYTQKVVKMVKMLRHLGHDVVLYGAEGSETEATEFVQTHTLQDIRESFGDGDNRFELGYDWSVGQTFRMDKTEPLSAVHLKWIKNASKELKDRWREGDFVLSCQGGHSWKAIADAVKAPATLEYGIGYLDTFARFKAYESNSLRSFISGQEYGKDASKHYNGNMMDRVIPNYYDPEDFPISVLDEKKGRYLLFMGRIIPNKGYMIAIKVAQSMGIPLVIAGQSEHPIVEDSVEYIGVVNDPIKKAKLMAGAIATLVPTQYMEPFGGVNVESQLCGTPALATSFGVFPETIINGETGFLCNRFSDFTNAVYASMKLDRMKIRKHAEKYLMENVEPLYQEWFEAINSLILEAGAGNKAAWYSL